jgi:hypothetical protein
MISLKQTVHLNSMRSLPFFTANVSSIQEVQLLFGYFRRQVCYISFLVPLTYPNLSFIHFLSYKLSNDASRLTFNAITHE